MTDYPTVDELKESIQWAIEQGGNDNYLLNDNFYPYIWGYYLHAVEKGGRGVLFAGILPVTVAQTRAQLSSALSGEPEEGDAPKYNIDWDIRNSISGTYLRLKKKDGSTVTMAGTFNFDTAEEGAERWLEQIKHCVAKGLWMTNEEYHKNYEEINRIFQDFFDKHCADGCDCPLIETCEVRWPTGIGLRGCRIAEFAEGPEGGYKTHLMTDENLLTAKTIATEARALLDGE